MEISISGIHALDLSLPCHYTGQAKKGVQLDFLATLTPARAKQAVFSWLTTEWVKEDHKQQPHLHGPLFPQ